MAEKNKTRERILNAAFELISNKGYLGTSTREIAQRSDVAEVTIFRHFTNKEKLFEAITERFFQFPDLDEALPGLLDQPLGQGVSTLAAMYVDKLSDIQKWLRICQSELQRNSVAIPFLCQSFMNDLLGVCSGYFHEAAKRGELGCSDAKAAAQMFIMCCYGFTHLDEMFIDKCDLNRQQFINTMVGIFVSGISNFQQQVSDVGQLKPTSDQGGDRFFPEENAMVVTETEEYGS